MRMGLRGYGIGEERRALAARRWFWSLGLWTEVAARYVIQQWIDTLANFLGKPIDRQLTSRLECIFWCRHGSKQKAMRDI